MLRNADGGGGGVKFSRKKRYEGVRSNVISVTRGWVGVKFPGKKHYVILEWPLRRAAAPSDPKPCIDVMSAIKTAIPTLVFSAKKDAATTQQEINKIKKTKKH